MLFTITGRFHATLRHDDASWTVCHTDEDSVPSLAAVDHFASLDANDIGHYLDTLLCELDEQGPIVRR